jgi:cell division protein ZapA
VTSRVIQIDVQGQHYAVRSELDPQYLAELAAYVDQKMRMAANELSSADSLRVAVIAALNLADELFRARRESPEGHLLARAADIERLVDRVLNADTAPQ